MRREAEFFPVVDLAACEWAIPSIEVPTNMPKPSSVIFREYFSKVVHEPELDVMLDNLRKKIENKSLITYSPIQDFCVFQDC